MPRAYVGFGANLRNPAAQVQAAMAKLAKTAGVRVLAKSPLYRSAPIGLPGQPDYCNAVCALETALAPAALFEILLDIERAAGRVRDGHRWGPRVLDLDLLHYEGLTLHTPQLKLPHPEIGRRNFVLAPLADIAPELQIPGLGRARALADAIGRDGLELWRE